MSAVNISAKSGIFVGEYRLDVDFESASTLYTW